MSYQTTTSYKIEVVRKRISVTQGFAKVIVEKTEKDGSTVRSESDWYGDDLVMDDNGPMGYASTTPDSSFIRAFLVEQGY